MDSIENSIELAERTLERGPERRLFREYHGRKSFYGNQAYRGIYFPYLKRGQQRRDMGMTSHPPLYCIVAKFSPIKLGRRNVSRSESHVPSPTCKVFEAYVLLPAAVSPESEGIMSYPMLFSPATGNRMFSQNSDLVTLECYEGTIEGDLIDPPLRRMHHAPIGMANRYLDSLANSQLVSLTT